MTLRTRAVAMALAVAIATPALAQSVARFGVRTPMRDGVELVSNVWLPDSVNRHPTILLRTPYDKTPQFDRYQLKAYVDAGYAVVLQDTRGRGDSDGAFDFYFAEGRDGHDTIEWIARQPWSNGRVGTDGGSYLGTVQWLAAREQPPHLACIIPTASSGRIFGEIPYLGGAFRMDWALPWINGVSGRVSQSALSSLVDWRGLMTRRPLLTMDDAMGRRMPLYRDILLHDTLDEYWKRIQFDDRDFARIQVPSLTVTGWFDGDMAGALSYWDGMSRRPTPKPPHYLIVGPWNHAGTYLGGVTKLGQLAFDTTSVIDIQKIRIAFFDWCLAQKAPRFDAPAARYYVTGAEEWRTGDRFPPVDAGPRSLYLRSGGAANTLSGNGALSWDPPGAEPPDTFTYDPKNPVPSRGSTADHTEIEKRADVLVYTTPVLTEPVEIVGRAFLTLHATSDARDTDFTAKLLDVFPDGRAVNLGPAAVSVIRARYRKGYESTVPLEPGRAEMYTIELFDLAHRFLPGHRIRLEVASSAAPFINPNQNTGLPVATDTTWVVARQTVHHDRARPSHLRLPVVEARP